MLIMTYRYAYDTDKEMMILKMVDLVTGNGRGMIELVKSFLFVLSLLLILYTIPSWFAVHCTSMNNTNGLISGDNKGHASYLMEKDMNKGALPGNVRPLVYAV